MLAKRILSTSLVLCAALTSTALTLKAQTEDDTLVITIREDRPDVNFVGQFINSGADSHQYGYISKIAGIDNVFNSATVKNESTAMFTFSTYAHNVQVVNNGPLRSVNRVGTTTIYYHPEGGATFADPTTFEAGIPIQVSDYDQHVDLAPAAPFPFVTVHVNTVTAANPFTFNGATTQLGNVDDAFRTQYVGTTNTGTPPPSGYFVGYALGIGRDRGNSANVNRNRSYPVDASRTHDSPR